MIFSGKYCAHPVEGRICSQTAIGEADGKLHCRTHSPEAIAKREAKREARIAAEQREIRARREAAEAVKRSLCHGYTRSDN